MPEPVQTPEQQSRNFSQHRRWLKTHFSLSQRSLNYSIENGKHSMLQKTLAFDTIGARDGYISVLEPDRELRWVAFTVTALAIFAVMRGGPQPLMIFLYAGLMVVLLAGLWLTRKMRRVGYTAIPASGINILVLDDRQHDTIIDAIEARRVAVLRHLAEPTIGISIRVYLRRLRWLVDNNVMSEDEFDRRRKLVLPDDAAAGLKAAQLEFAPQHVHQRRLGCAIDVTLLADRLTYRRSDLFGSTDRHCVAYRDLQQPSMQYGVDHQYELAALILAWCFIPLFAWMSAVSNAHPGNHYVGGEGLSRAIVDFGPALLAMVACAAIVPLLTRLRYAEPYSGIRLLRDKQYGALLSAMETRRIAAQRAMAEPDPLLTFDEQMQVLSDLHEAGILSDEAESRAAKRAAFVCDNPMLDLPAMPQSQSPQRRRRAVH